ncbi:MAG: SurA N-terminal domain-containing protein [Spartobacteria bacterium]
MIQVLRKNQRVLMLVVAVLTIVAFIFLYNTTQLDELATIKNPTIYGKALTPLAIDRQVKNYQLTLALGQFELLQKLGGTSPDQDRALTEFIWNLLVLQHQSRELGVEPTDDQVASRIKQVPIFQSAGQFDPLKYGQFVSEQLAPRGFTERQLEDVIRDSLRMEAIGKIVEAPAAISEGELQSMARAFQPVTAGFVKFERKQEADKIQISPEEVAAIHQQNQAALMTEETREAQCVVFQLPADSKLEGKEKVDALQKLANAASELTDSLAQGGASLEQLAQKAGAKIVKLAAFDRAGKPAQDASAPDAETMADLAPAAFLVPKAGAASDVIQSGDAFYIIEVTAVNPTRPLTLDEARPRIEEQLRAQKAEQIFTADATSAANALRAAVAAGKSFAEAAAAQKLKVEEIKNVVAAAESTSPENQAIAGSTLLLKEGEISNLEAAPWGAFVAQLQSRAPVDQMAFGARETQIRESLLRNKRDLLFMEWLRVGREAARITVPTGRQG